MANTKPKSAKKPLQLIILIFLGIICILISILVRHACEDGKSCENNIIIADLLNALGDALIIGPTLSWILDLPAMIDYFKRITVESLISKDYLNTLPRDKLLELRKECTQKIHLKDSETVEKGLINLDESVCDLLTQPYCERFRQNTVCHSEGDYFKKKHYIEEYIINPLDKKVTYKDFPKTYLEMEPGQVVDDVYKISNLTVKIDDDDEKDITAQVKVLPSDVTQTDIHYSFGIYWADLQGNPLTFDFTKSLTIKKVVIVITKKTDINYYKRVTMPVKSFKIDYTYSGSDLKLIGSCFGTLSYPTEGGMKIIQEDSYISIESFNWMLPGNGIFIVKVPK
ncbi:MAG: hypothetical protein ABI741_07720 [Ferruginibacter sp.]